MQDTNLERVGRLALNLIIVNHASDSPDFYTEQGGMWVDPDGLNKIDIPTDSEGNLVMMHDARCERVSLFPTRAFLY